MPTKKKRVVDVDIYGDEKNLNFKGRLLGLVTDKEYNKLIKSKTLCNKLATVETKAVKDIADRENIEDLRIAIVIKEKEGSTLFNKKLFFSEPLDMVCNVTSDSEIALSGKYGAYLLLEEKGA